jgi:ABC-type phosphate transport system permease subunit
LKSKQYLKEKIIKNVFFLSSLTSIFFLLGISFILFKEGLPLFREIDLKSFFWGKSWYPTYSPPEFGLLPLILGTLWVTLGALIIAVPLGVSAAIYISELATPKTKNYLDANRCPLSHLRFFRDSSPGPLVAKSFKPSYRTLCAYCFSITCPYGHSYYCQSF